MENAPNFNPGVFMILFLSFVEVPVAAIPDSGARLSAPKNKLNFLNKFLLFGIFNFEVVYVRCLKPDNLK